MVVCYAQSWQKLQQRTARRCLEHHYLLLGKLCNLGVCAWLLSAELIAGEREDLEPAPRELTEE